MSEEENKSLIKKESAFVEKVGNQIAVTNKLLLTIDSIDYLKWWDELDDNWKVCFTFYIKRAILKIDRKIRQGKECTYTELMVSKYIAGNDNFKISIGDIKYLLSLKSIDLVRNVPDLIPLKLFAELEELEITTLENKSLAPLQSLKKLKLFDCSGGIFSKEEIEQFKKDHPNCEVVTSEEKNLAREYFEKGNDLQYKQKRFNEASAYYLKAIDLLPNYLEALNNYAQNLRNNIKNYSEAIVYYTKVIDINPKYEYAISRRGLCKGELKDYGGQIEDLSKLIEYEPNNLDQYISRTLIRKKIDDHKGIIDDCSYVVSTNEINTHAYSSALQYRGEAKVALSDIIGGISDLEKAIEIEFQKSNLDSDYRPMLFGSLKSCGVAKLSINNFQGALDTFEKLVAFAPSNPQPYKLRAIANEKIGNLDAYKKDMALFRKLNAEHFEKYGVSFE